MKPVKVWKNYWKDQNLKGERFSTKLRSYQLPVFSLLKKTIKENNIKFILSAGAGQDIICFNLQKEFKNQIEITVLDISKDVLDWNKKIFKKHCLNAKFVEADIFKMPFRENSFDLVFNTGVLEHFKNKEQINIAKEILRVLKPSGRFITANPSDSGKIYKWGMKMAKEKEIWPFGREIPIKSLDFLRQEIQEIDSIKEYHKDFLTQLSFLNYANPIFRQITLPIKLLSKLPYVSQSYDLLFSRIFGTYLIISIIKKK